MNRVYLASPFFDDKQCETLSKVENILRNKGLNVFSPREHDTTEGSMGDTSWSLDNFNICTRGIDCAEVVVALYYGNYSDSGTAWEMGYAFASHKPVIVVHLEDDSNLMIHESATSNIMGIEELEKYDFDKMPRQRYKGQMH